MFEKIPLTTTSFTVYRANRKGQNLDKIPIGGRWNYGGFLSTTLNSNYAKRWIKKAHNHPSANPELLKIIIPPRSKVFPLLDINKIYNYEWIMNGNKESIMDKIIHTYHDCFVDKDQALIDDLKRQHEKFPTDRCGGQATEYEILLSNKGYLLKTGEEIDHKGRKIYLFTYHSS